MFIEKCESLKALEDLVKEKETLLSELHHRTKNNLAIISGIIDLQNGFSDNPEVLAYSDTIRERIQNIALIHEQLSSTGKFSQLSFFEYLDLLIRKLEVNYIKDKTLHKTLQIESFYITDLSQMVSVGILLNEILLNAFKHAFRNSSYPKLLIEAKKINNSIYIRIKDNGPGIKDKENIFDSNTTVGMRIIHGLLNQLRAKFTVNTNEGTEYLIQLDTLKTIDQ
jgi:two-component sensor histidine kinase